MQVLVLDDDINRQYAVAHALQERGLFVLRASDAAAANAYLRRTIADVVILRHWIGKRACLSAALAAEYYNPQVVTILLSDQPGGGSDELFELIPSLSALLGEATPPALIADLAVSAVAPRKKEALVLGREDRIWPEPKRPTLPDVPVFVSRRSGVLADRIPA